MCKSKEEGGQRCTAHTRPRYDAFIAEIDACPPGMFGRAQREQVRQRFEMEGENAVNIVANHASTGGRNPGWKDIERDIERFKQAGMEASLTAFMQSQLNLGRARGDANAEATQTIQRQTRLAKARTEGWRQKGSKDLMKPTKNLVPGNSCSDVVPQIADGWRAEDNEGVTPDQVTFGSNNVLNWRCPQGHLIEGRVNLVVSRLRDEGKWPLCPECQPHRQRQFQAAQQNLQQLVGVLDGDAKAFECISPAMRFSLLRKAGLLNAGRGDMQRDLSMSIVHGDLTLDDVMRADDLAKIDKKIREDLNEDEANLGAIANIEVDDTKTRSTSTSTAVKQTMASAGVLALVEGDEELTGHIMRENIDNLWEHAYLNPDGLDRITRLVNAERDRSVFAAELADRFTAELDTVRNMPLPDGYQTERTLPDGTTVTMDPTLMQRRFMYEVERNRRYMNWSGTGAGKTIAATLAVQNAGARETVIVCPKQVIGQWSDEFTNGFGDRVQVRIGLPDHDEPPAPDGVNRVWIANYDKFQGEDDAVEAKTSRLIGRVDAIVYDEIHSAKRSDPGTSSRRRNALEKFTDAAGEANPDLVVIGASATPVVINLEEAASVLRLVEGPDSKSFPTAPTIKNAAAAHHRLAAAGMRHLPTYPTKLNPPRDVTVDISDRVAHVHARVQAIQKARQQAGKPGNRVHPATMERALLPEKLPAITDAVRNANGPSVVYTEYTHGMVEPMKAHLEREGFRVRTYTGNETDRERADALRAFRDGQADVLIGSRPLSTGVDGLQNVSNNLVVASMPWTAAADDQLVGRLQRRGQQRDVNVTYVLTEAKVGKTRWSWCKDNRRNRIKFRRSLADAAVDGVIPDGILDSGNAGAEESATALNSLVTAFSKSQQASA